MSLTKLPSQVFDAGASGFAFGLAGTIGVQIIDTPGSAVITARTTAGITEVPASSGLYFATLTAPGTVGDYAIIWDDASGNYADEDLSVVAASFALGVGAPNEKLVNAPAVFTLAASVTSSQTSITVNEAGFPATPNFRVRVENELMQVTGSSSPYTVVRGVEGTTKASHASGAQLTIIATAGQLNQWWADSLNATGIGPSTSNNGKVLTTTSGAFVWSAAPSDPLKAPLASPTFTGTVTLPSAVAGTPTFSGTVTAPITDKAGQFFNVKAYGALGDGTTDDATAVQVAITAAQSAGGGIVFFPIGVYKCNTGLTVTAPSVRFLGAGWDQTTTTVGSIIKAGGTLTDLINVSSLGERFTMTDMSLDGNGTATNLLTVDALNCQFTRCYGRRPATSGTGFNVTANGTSAWFTDCRFNGANQAGCVGFAINGTDSMLHGCKAVNCVDSVTYGSTASGGQQTGCHHTPGSTIGRCAINIAGNAANLILVGNRIDSHHLGSGIQVTPSANIVGLQIVANTFYPGTALTDNTFAAIGLDTTSAHIYQCVINGNIVRSSSVNRYAALLTAQTLAGSAASNPTRISGDGVTVNGNSVYAAALFGTNSTPLVAWNNTFSTDGTTWSDAAPIAPLASPSFTGTATIPNIAGPTTFTGTVTLSPSTVLSGAPGDHVILASDNTLTTEADYVDVLPTLDNSVLMGMSTGGAVWTERVLPVPARRRGYLGWSFNPTMNGGGAVNTSTTPMLTSIEIEEVGTISHIDVVVTTLGTTLTSGQCLVGAYRLRSGGSGTADLIALSADQGTAWVSGTGSTGTKHIAVSVQGTASLACTPGDVIYGAILANGTTPPQFGVVGGSTGATMTNAGLTLPDFKAGTFTTGQTTLPSTMNFTSGITTIGTSRFFGVS